MQEENQFFNVTKEFKTIEFQHYQLRKSFEMSSFIVAWENENLEFQKHDGGFECKDGKTFLIYGVHNSLLA